jgi:hypothetical protein
VHSLADEKNEEHSNIAFFVSVLLLLCDVSYIIVLIYSKDIQKIS